MDWLLDQFLRTQMGWTRAADLLAVVLIAVFLLNVCLSVWIVWSKGSRPNAALAWIATLFAFPLLGLAFYILVGENRIGLVRRRRHKRIVAAVKANEPLWTDPRVVSRDLSGPDSQLARLAEKLQAPPVLNGNHIDITGDPEEMIRWMVDDLDAAVSTAHMIFYIFEADATGERVCQAMERAAARGVTCRMLLDSVGSKEFLESDRRRQLEFAGVKVVEALPASLLRVLLARVDIRNHRKVLVVDGKVAHTGSRNVADPTFKQTGRLGRDEPYVDCWMRVHGPVALDLQTIFVEDWELDTGEDLSALLDTQPAFVVGGVPAQVIPSGPNFENAVVPELIQASIQLARREVMLSTPYYIPDDATVSAMEVAARRGLRVTLIVPRANDSVLCAYASRAHFDRLLDAGVEVWEYRAGFLHSKTVCVDDDIAIITTANLDRRSYEINFETSVAVYDRATADRLRTLLNSYVARSSRMDLVSWSRRPRLEQLAERAANLVSPLL
ncbi:MAG: cardiolipin synthase [Phycisphaerales bacterium]